MKDWLLRPFPFVQSNRQIVLISLFTGVFVTLFLLIFKPFGISVYPSPLLYLSGYGLISFGAIYFSLQIPPFLMPSWFSSTTWNVLKNILFMSWILLLVSIFNWLYAMTLSQTFGSTADYFKEMPVELLENIGMTFSVGIFPILIINYILERQLFGQNVRLAKVLEKTMDSTSSIPIDYASFEITTDRNKSILISSQNLLTVKAEGGNYATVYWLEDRELKSQLWRVTLKNLLSKIESDQNILQCHKSYLVNRSFITEVFGNARTLTLRLEALDFEIPVSRNFPRELVEHYHLHQA